MNIPLSPATNSNEELNDQIINVMTKMDIFINSIFKIILIITRVLISLIPSFKKKTNINDINMSYG